MFDRFLRIVQTLIMAVIVFAMCEFSGVSSMVIPDKVIDAGDMLVGHPLVGNMVEISSATPIKPWCSKEKVDLAISKDRRLCLKYMASITSSGSGLLAQDLGYVILDFSSVPKDLIVYSDAPMHVIGANYGKVATVSGDDEMKRYVPIVSVEKYEYLSFDKESQDLLESGLNSEQ